jgi:hypothetical protein
MKTFGKLLVAIMLAYAAYLVSVFINGGMSAVLHQSVATGRLLLQLAPALVFLVVAALIYFGIKRNNSKP